MSYHQYFVPGRRTVQDMYMYMYIYYVFKYTFSTCIIIYAHMCVSCGVN